MVEALEAGVAAHHAGLVPAFRETVEECFAAGLLKVVFATETLSLGINMPARSVVIERFTKFGGADAAALTSGEYLAAHRAGRPPGARRRGPRRRALVPGHAVRRGGPGRVAPPPDLRSAFRPTYNLAVNLVRRLTRRRGPRRSLDRSFAQWQAPAGPGVPLGASSTGALAVLERAGVTSTAGA